MSRQIHREDVPPVIAEVAALQAEQRVVEPGAMDEHHGGLLRVELVRRGIGEGRLAVDCEIHLEATFSERSRSSIRSCASSRPTDSRMVPGPMPDFFRSSSLM